MALKAPWYTFKLPDTANNKDDHIRRNHQTEKCTTLGKQRTNQTSSEKCSHQCNVCNKQ